MPAKTRTFVSWNLEKLNLVQESLSKLSRSTIDVALFQEYDQRFTQRKDIDEEYFKFEAISFETFGTAIFSREKPVRTYEVKSPHFDYRAKFWKGPIYKNTAVAVWEDLTAVSFHGFNGTGQGRDPKMLVDHVNAVLAVIPDGPCVIAGDFNTFTSIHQAMVLSVMRDNGFDAAIRVPYQPGTSVDDVEAKILDWVLTKECTATLKATSHDQSDHPFMVFTVEVDQ